MFLKPFSLLSVLLLLLLGVWLALRSAPTAAPAWLLSQTDWQSLQQIKIQSAKANLTLERRDNRWWLAGQTLPLRPFRVEQLQGLTTLTWQRQWSISPELLHNFALDAPRLSFDFNGKILAFGEDAPFSSQRCYARFEQQIGLISPCPQAFFGLALQDWLSLQVLLPEEQLSAIEMGLCQAQQQNGLWSWSLERSQDDLQTWLQAWQYLQAYHLQPSTKQDKTIGTQLSVKLQGLQRTYQFQLQIIDNEGFLWADAWVYFLSKQQVKDIYPSWCRAKS